MLKDPNIVVTVLKNQRGLEEEIKINHLAILSINEVHDYVDTAVGGKRIAFQGTHIGHIGHPGYMVREKEPEIQRRIEMVATRCYLGVCSKSCCPRG